MKKEKVINQPGQHYDCFIVVDYFKKIDTIINTPCYNFRYIKGESSVGIWKVKSLKN